MTKLRDLTAQRFGRLAVVGPYRRVGGSTRWPCRCDCGTEVEVRAHDLTKGAVRSCGCYRRERTGARAATHGLGKPPEYNVWSKMRQRCQNPDSPDYVFYGGRGITVCERWQDFAAFYADMGPRPSKNHQIDRIGNDGNYEPGNCRWATRIEQGNNRRSNAPVKWRGESLTIPEWSRRTGLKEGAIYQRIHKLGWSAERAFTTPVRKRRAPQSITV